MNKKKVALISGATGGLGQALTEELLQKEYVVYVGARDLQKVQKRDQCIPIFLDLAQKESIDSAIDHIIAEQGDFDLLVNNGGYGLFGAVDAVKREEMKHQFEVNVFGPMQLSQNAVSFFRKKQAGTIVFVSSLAGVIPYSYLGAYSGSKAAIKAMAVSLAMAVARWNIRVLVIEPGAIKTQFTEKLKKGTFYPEQSDPYAQFHAAAEVFLKEIVQNGQEPADVARQIIEEISTPSKKVCYQPCDRSRELIKTFYAEAFSEEWMQEELDLIQQWFR